MQLPTFKYEKQIWKKGYKCIAGIDEVGRGSFAGPVVAGVVVFAPVFNFQFSIFNEKGQKIIINDSKKMTAKQREVAAKWIKENCLAWGIGEASAACINRIGIVKATEMAFREAIMGTNGKLAVSRSRIADRGEPSEGRLAIGDKRIDYLLIDAFYIPYVKGLRRKNQKAIVHGDAVSVSIAAASIIAKVHRDQLMEKIGKRARYTKYDWIHNKGYGTPKHLEAITKYGINGYHRKLFCRNLI